MLEKYLSNEFNNGSRVYQGFTLYDLNTQMQRLDSTSNMSALPSARRLIVAIEADSYGIKPVARKHSLSQHVVTRSRRDVAAALAFLSGSFDEIKDPKVLTQAKKLASINEELAVLSRIVKDFPIRKLLKDIPHVKELIDEYIKNRSYRDLLDEFDVPYRKDQLRSVRHFLTTDSAEDASKRGLATLSRRYILSKWLSGGIKGIDDKIASIAFDAFQDDISALPTNQRNQIWAIRAFLRKIMDLEFRTMGKDAGNSKEHPNLFPPSYVGGDNDIINAYFNFANANYCPLALKKYARMAVNQLPIKERTRELFGTQYDIYSYNRLVDIDDKGLMFLENILARPDRQLDWQSLTLSTSSRLREIKQAILQRNAQTQNKPV